MAAKQIIILDVKPGPGGDQNVHWLGWYPVPAGQEMSGPAAGSVWPKATTAENAAITSGSVIEKENWDQFNKNWTPIQVRNALMASWTQTNADIQAGYAALGPKKFYGFCWDGTTWTQVP